MHIISSALSIKSTWYCCNKLLICVVVNITNSVNHKSILLRKSNRIKMMTYKSNEFQKQKQQLIKASIWYYVIKKGFTLAMVLTNFLNVSLSKYNDRILTKETQKNYVFFFFFWQTLDYTKTKKKNAWGTHR